MGLCSLPLGEYYLGPFRAQSHSAVHIALCICGGLSPSAKVCVGTWEVTLQKVIAHMRACVYQCGQRGLCVLTWLPTMYVASYIVVRSLIPPHFDRSREMRRPQAA